MKKSMLAISAITLSVSAANAATISNGNIALGVDQFGQLGTGGLGIRDTRTNREAITPGCVCEGWGVANAADGTVGYANNSSGSFNVTNSSFTSSASSAQTVTTIGGTSNFKVTHDFGASASADLFRVNVTIENTGANTVNDLRYRRVMDWDIEPTPFSEYVTLQGVGASALLYSSDNGFASSNPLSAGGSLVGGTINQNFVDSGPSDHGALFDFGFGALGAGQTKTFQIFYGAALSEPGALAALGAVGAEVYSFGQSRNDINGGTAGYSTFVFGFKGVGGRAIGGVPEPTTWAMLIAGFGMVGGAMRRRTKLSVTYA